MTSVQKTMRLPEQTVQAIETIARHTGKDFSAIAKELLEEAVRMRRFPGVVYAEGVHGRRARIAGSGIEVWELVATYKALGENRERLRAACHWLTQWQIRAALAYYGEYTEEIDELIGQNAGWNRAELQAKYPFLSDAGQ